MHSPFVVVVVVGVVVVAIGFVFSASEQLLRLTASEVAMGFVRELLGFVSWDGAALLRKKITYDVIVVAFGITVLVWTCMDNKLTNAEPCHF